MDPNANNSALLKLADYVASGMGSVAGTMLALAESVAKCVNKSRSDAKTV